MGSFLAYYLPLRARNPSAHASISLGIIAQVANSLLSRSAHVRGEDFLPYDADDLVGICINLIDQVIRFLNKVIDVGLCKGTYCDGEEGVGCAEDGTIRIYQSE